MRAGINAETGELLTGWDHCVQSVRKIVTTRFESRGFRRHLGSRVPELQDDNASALTIFKTFAAVAEALADPDGGEPGFSLQSIDTAEYGPSGRFRFILNGVYYPRGHLGDWTVSETATISV